MKSVTAISKGYETLKRAPQDLEEQIQTRMKGTLMSPLKISLCKL